MIRTDRDFMAAPDNWPMWPLLPLKRYLDGPAACPQSGYLWDPIDEQGRAAVFLGNIYTANPETDAFMEYDSIDAIVADGWVVD